MGKPKKVVKRSNIMNRRKPGNKTKTKPKKKPTKLLKGGGFEGGVSELMRKEKEKTLTSEEIEKLKKLREQAEGIIVQRKASARRAQERQQTAAAPAAAAAAAAPAAAAAAAAPAAAADAKQIIKEQENLKREEHKSLVDNQTKYITQLEQSLINIDNENTRINAHTSHPSSEDLVALLTEKYSEITHLLHDKNVHLVMLGTSGRELTQMGLNIIITSIDDTIKEWEIYSSHLEQLILLNESIKDTKTNLTHNRLEDALLSVEKSTHIIGYIKNINITDATLNGKKEELLDAAAEQQTAYEVQKEYAAAAEEAGFELLGGNINRHRRTRKQAKKSGRKSGRKSAKKRAKKSSKKTGRKSSKKAATKTGRKSSKKTGRKSSKKTGRKSARKSAKKRSKRN